MRTEGVSSGLPGGGPASRRRGLRAGFWLSLMLAIASDLVAAAEAPLEVRISGIEGETLQNVEAALSINQRRHQTLSTENIRSLHDKARGEIRRALEPYGFYQPVIDGQLNPPESATEVWVADYRIDAGEPVRIDELDIHVSGPGDGDENIAAYLSGLPLAVDQPLRHPVYEQTKIALLTEIHNMGYLDARLVEHRVEVDLDAYNARVRLAIDTGQLYVFGEIRFSQHQFADRYLQKFLILEPGQAFSRQKITRQRQLLVRSNQFQEVLIEEGKAEGVEENAIPVTIELTPYLANRYRGQLGWGTDTGLGFQGDWTRRYIGRHGHRFNLGGSAVDDQDRLAGDLRYTIPWQPLTGERLELSLRHQSRVLTPADVDLEQGGETRILNNYASGYWYFPKRTLGDFQLSTRTGVSLVQDSYDIFEVLFGNLPDASQGIIADAIGQEAVDTLAPDFASVTPSIRFTARRTDDRLFIRNGDYLRLELLAADETLGSNVDFWQARLSTWTIRSLGAKGRVLMRTAVGYSDAETQEVLGAKFNQMPELYEFRAGGARSVRGYRFEELFPDDAITGGKHQLVGSVEYEHEIMQDISVAAFVDAGNAFNDWDNIDEKVGAGFGVRWRSPVGVVRVDLAAPLDDSEESIQLYVTVGPEF